MNSRKSSNKSSGTHVQPYEECSLNPQNRKNQATTGAFRLLPIEVIPNPSILSKNGSGDSGVDQDDAFVFPPPPALAQPTKPVKPPPLRVPSKNFDDDDVVAEPHKRPTLLTTSKGTSNFYIQKTNFENSPCISQLSLGSDDQTPDTPPPNFKPPAPTRSTATSPPPLTEQELRDNAKKNRINSSTSPTFGQKPNPSRTYDDRSNKSLTPFAAARLSLRKRKDNKPLLSKEAEPDDFVSLHRKAQTSLRLAVRDKVSGNLLLC